MIKTTSLLRTIHTLFDPDAQTDGEFWASHIQAGSSPSLKLFTHNITANQLRQLIQVAPAGQEGQEAWLDSELLDTIIGLFLIAKGSNLTVDEACLHHTVSTHHDAQIRVFGCDFSKWICMHDITTRKLKRRFKDHVIATDERWWCPAHIASQPTSTHQGLGCHYVVIKPSLDLRQVTSSDSLRDNGSFTETIQWLARKFSQIPNLLLDPSRMQSARPWRFPFSQELHHMEQINSSDCAIHLIADLAQTLFGIAHSARTVQRLRQNLPILLVAFYLTHGNLKNNALHHQLQLEIISQ
jgi:hypothetical protein